MKYTYTAKILIHIYEEYMDKKRKKVLTEEGKSRNILKYFFSLTNPIIYIYIYIYTLHLWIAKYVPHWV